MLRVYQLNKKLEGNCDFSSNNNIWARFYEFLWRPFFNFVRLFLVCRLDKLLSWFPTQTSVVNFRCYLFCLCNVRRQYLLPGILGIYCFLTGVPSLPAIALPKGCICSLVNQVYTSFPLMSLPPFGLH